VISVLEPILGRPAAPVYQPPEPSGLANRADSEEAAARVMALLGPTPVTIDDLFSTVRCWRRGCPHGFA